MTDAPVDYEDFPSWSGESGTTHEPLQDNYPHEWEADVVLRDGSIANLRAITPADGDRLRRFHAGQSEESIYLRFFAPDRYELVGKALNERDLEDPAPEAV